MFVKPHALVVIQGHWVKVTKWSTPTLYLSAWSKEYAYQIWKQYLVDIEGYRHGQKFMDVQSYKPINRQTDKLKDREDLKKQSAPNYLTWGHKITNAD